MRIRKADATPEQWSEYCKYQREYQRALFLRDPEKVRERKRAYNAKDRVREARRLRDSAPEAVAKRKAYQLTPEAKARAKERHRDNFVNDPEYRTKRNADGRLRRTGFDPVLVAALIAQQGNRCALCQIPFTERRMVADHCHATNQPRGLLCHHCNIIDGMMARVDMDPVELVHRLVAYRSKPPASFR